MKIIKTFENFSEDKEYTFDELSQEAKDRAIEKERESMHDSMGDWWYEDVIQSETDKLIEEGFSDSDMEILFDGFNSQGDGASFTGRVNDNGVFVKETLGMKIPDAVTDNIFIEVVRTDSRHVHENTVRLDCEVDGEEEVEIINFGADIIINANVEDYCEDVNEKGGEWLKSRCIDIFNRLRKEYDGYFEESHIIADIKANGTLFDEEGNVI